MILYQPFSPVDIRFATISSLQEILAGLSDKRLLILSSEGTIKRLKAKGLLTDLLDKKQNCVIRDVRPNPSVDDIRALLNALRQVDKFELILAVGGGSSIDLAKAVSALQWLGDTHELKYNEIVESIQQKKFFQEYKPAEIIAVPTTAGTGSEVTKWATVWDFKGKKKLSVEHPGCFPSYAIIVPELTADLTQRLTLTTGLDALSHAMEAFWARDRNPLSQSIALDSIRRIMQSLPDVLVNLEDVELRKEMCIGSVMAGLAFSMTRTTACHSISYPLTLNYGIEHGFAAAITLLPILTINRKAVPEIESILRVFGGVDGFESWLGCVSKGVQELKLSALGIDSSMIDNIVEGAFTQGRMDNNPVELNREDVKQVLNKLV